MAKFDIIAATSKGYQDSWAERHYLLRLAAVPFFIQLVCLTLATSLAGDANLIRFSLIMTPAYLAEGWMLSHYVRLLASGDRWPFRPSGDRERDMAILLPRARGILGGTIVYTLIQMGAGLFVALATLYLAPYMEQSDPSKPPEVPGAVAFACFIMIGFMIWAIRLVWLYIPYALNGSGRDYLQRLRGAGSSVYIAGLWLLCVLPFFLSLQLLHAIALAPLGQALGGGAGAFLALMLRVTVEILRNLVLTAAMVHALSEIYKKTI